eukprot:GSA25T00010528001.1
MIGRPGVVNNAATQWIAGARLAMDAADSPRVDSARPAERRSASPLGNRRLTPPIPDSGADDGPAFSTAADSLAAAGTAAGVQRPIVASIAAQEESFAPPQRAAERRSLPPPTPAAAMNAAVAHPSGRSSGHSTVSSMSSGSSTGGQRRRDRLVAPTLPVTARSLFEDAFKHQRGGHSSSSRTNMAAAESGSSLVSLHPPPPSGVSGNVETTSRNSGASAATVGFSAEDASREDQFIIGARVRRLDNPEGKIPSPPGVSSAEALARAQRRAEESTALHEALSAEDGVQVLLSNIPAKWAERDLRAFLQQIVSATRGVSGSGRNTDASGNILQGSAVGGNSKTGLQGHQNTNVSGSEGSRGSSSEKVAVGPASTGPSGDVVHFVPSGDIKRICVLDSHGVRVASRGSSLSAVDALAVGIMSSAQTLLPDHLALSTSGSGVEGEGASFAPSRGGSRTSSMQVFAFSGTLSPRSSTASQATTLGYRPLLGDATLAQNADDRVEYTRASSRGSNFESGAEGVQSSRVVSGETGVVVAPTGEQASEDTLTQSACTSLSDQQNTAKMSGAAATRWALVECVSRADAECLARELRHSRSTIEASPVTTSFLHHLGFYASTAGSDLTSLRPTAFAEPSPSARDSPQEEDEKERLRAPTEGLSGERRDAGHATSMRRSQPQRTDTEGTQVTQEDEETLVNVPDPSEEDGRTGTSVSGPGGSPNRSTDEKSRHCGRHDSTRHAAGTRGDSTGTNKTSSAKTRAIRRQGSGSGMSRRSSRLDDDQADEEGEFPQLIVPRGGRGRWLEDRNPVEALERRSGGSPQSSEDLLPYQTPGRGPTRTVRRGTASNGVTHEGGSKTSSKDRASGGREVNENAKASVGKSETEQLRSVFSHVRALLRDKHAPAAGEQKINGLETALPEDLHSEQQGAAQQLRIELEEAVVKVLERRGVGAAARSPITEVRAAGLEDVLEHLLASVTAKLGSPGDDIAASSRSCQDAANSSAKKDANALQRTASAESSSSGSQRGKKRLRNKPLHQKKVEDASDLQRTEDVVEVANAPAATTCPPLLLLDSEVDNAGGTKGNPPAPHDDKEKEYKMAPDASYLHGFDGSRIFEGRRKSASGADADASEGELPFAREQSSPVRFQGIAGDAAVYGETFAPFYYDASYEPLSSSLYHTFAFGGTTESAEQQHRGQGEEVPGPAAYHHQHFNRNEMVHVQGMKPTVESSTLLNHVGATAAANALVGTSTAVMESAHGDHLTLSVPADSGFDYIATPEAFFAVPRGALPDPLAMASGGPQPWTPLPHVNPYPPFYDFFASGPTSPSVAALPHVYPPHSPMSPKQTSDPPLPPPPPPAASSTTPVTGSSYQQQRRSVVHTSQRPHGAQKKIPAVPREQGSRSAGSSWAQSKGKGAQHRFSGRLEPRGERRAKGKNARDQDQTRAATRTSASHQEEDSIDNRDHNQQNPRNDTSSQVMSSSSRMVEHQRGPPSTASIARDSGSNPSIARDSQSVSVAESQSVLDSSSQRRRSGPGSLSTSQQEHQKHGAAANKQERRRRNRRARQVAVGQQENSEGKCTTLMVQNLPLDLDMHHLLAVFQDQGFTGGHSFDFFYLPRNFETTSSHGYCFVNFLTQELATRFAEALSGAELCSRSGEPGAALEITPAEAQGFTANTERWRKNRSGVRNPYFRPFLFYVNDANESVRLPVNEESLRFVENRRTKNTKGPYADEDENQMNAGMSSSKSTARSDNKQRGQNNEAGGASSRGNQDLVSAFLTQSHQAGAAAVFRHHHHLRHHLKVRNSRG